jgi:cysteinyl-tRNA synthetase
MPLRLYNTLTRQVETFREDTSRPVLFYSCGPTVYDFAHIGNFRSFLNADLLRRTLELLGYTVRHVMNMTDVGHMTEDDIADGAGEDKMAEAARRIREAKKSGMLPPEAAEVDPNDPHAIAEFYITAFKRDAKLLGLKVVEEAERDPSLLPRPTQYVQQMIALIETLIAKRHAYVARDGAVYFDVQSFPKYGRLSGNTLDKLRAGEGGRVSAENQAVKKHPADFLLWKRDPSHLMRWPSPWGEGYPGWHLECSAMARALLDEEIDIHSGGEDNIFPHHECEIAQTCSATGRPVFARHWFHTRHLFVEGEKMSKSKGNFYTVSDLLARGASPAAIRLALISTHYRANANFTMKGLKDAQRRIDRWMRVREALPAPARTSSQAPLSAFANALSDDLNISSAIAAIDESIDSMSNRATLDALLDALGILHVEYRAAADSDDLAATVESRIVARNEARRNKDFAAADRIREELRAMGVEIKDSPQGTTWERIIQ